MKWDPRKFVDMARCYFWLVKPQKIRKFFEGEKGRRICDLWEWAMIEPCVVSFLIKDPQDYIGNKQGAFYQFKSGYDGKNESLNLGLTTAVGNETWGGLVQVTRRTHKAWENQGRQASNDRNGTKSNPADGESLQALLKGTWRPSSDHFFKLNSEIFHSDTEPATRASIVIVHRAGPLASTFVFSGESACR